MNVACVKYRGFWAVAFLRQETIIGYWSVGRGEWIPETQVADITLWTQKLPAIEYIEDNLTRLFSAPIIRVDAVLGEAMK